MTSHDVIIQKHVLRCILGEFIVQKAQSDASNVRSVRFTLDSKTAIFESDHILSMI